MYSKVIVTNLPAFYKVNLFNEINKRTKILVIFTLEDADIRNSNFYNDDIGFECIYLNESSTFKKAIRLVGIIKDVDYNQVIIGGWSSPLFWLVLYFSSSKKNALIVESSYLESQTAGWKGLIKKIFLKRISTVFASGHSQMKLVRDLGYMKRVIVTKGVGIFNTVPQRKFKEVREVKDFLYIGRFSKEKNLTSLIHTFVYFPHYCLNLIGYGPEEENLKKIAGRNVVFHGAIDNALLPVFFQSNDVLILPSFSEPWGLVVEEAFNNGLPVIVSNRVGCAEEIVMHGENGLVFDIEDADGLKNSVEKITDLELYNSLIRNISKMDFEKTAISQVDCFLK